MTLYDYYYSNSRFSKVISKTATLILDNTYSTNTEIEKERISMYPFRSRFSLIANAPLRARFKLSTGSVSYSPTNPGMFKLTNTQIQYSSAFLCYFRKFASYTSMDQGTEYIEMKAHSCTSSSTNLEIIPPRSMSISSSNYYELIVMPIGINPAGCSLLGCASQSGFQHTNFEAINFLAYSATITSPAIVNGQYYNLYKYQQDMFTL